MKIKGVPVDMNKEYLVATNDFMASGGDEYTSFKDSAIVNEFPALDKKR
ncbi:5'-nucleotidase C-terminal domain-containing protein [Cytobacillus firmus]|nr:5'-nucleotidase C-terminal domain-containing protein [Cytobacillus firmus]